MTYTEYMQMVSRQTTRKRTEHPEHDMQAECYRWYLYQWKKYDDFLYANVNGVYCTITQARILKAEGMVSGVPDMFMPLPRQGYHGLFLELKNGKKNNLTSNQKRLMGKYKGQGYRCEVIRSFDGFQSVINDYLTNDTQQVELEHIEAIPLDD